MDNNEQTATITTPMNGDETKQLGEWALTAGRFYQSQQTGFVHLNYSENEQKSQTIPLYENLLFVLTLFRSRMVEQVQEGKELLKKILFFQNRTEESNRGNFPIYLHEYPFCHDPAMAIRLLAPFYWILKQFGHILGNELKHRCEEAVQLALEYSIKADQTKHFPYFLKVRLAAAEYQFGLHHIGKEKLDLLSHQQLEGWHDTRHLAEILIGLQMVYHSFLNTPWEPLWKRMEETWHPVLSTYIGPSVREWQEGLEPQSGLYDLFASYFLRRFSQHTTHLAPHHLHGILVRPCPDKFSEKREGSVSGILKEQQWTTLFNRHDAYTLLEKKGPFQPVVDKTHTPFRFVWGDLQRLHSLVFQGGNIEKLTYSREGNTIMMMIDLRDHPIDETENLPKKEVECFIDFQTGTHFYLNESPTTTFKLDAPLQIIFNNYRLTAVFELIQGEGEFMGHIVRGNRPSQIDNKGDRRFQAYDWTFFLRSIRRGKNCRLQLSLTIEEEILS